MHTTTRTTPNLEAPRASLRPARRSAGAVAALLLAAVTLTAVAELPPASAAAGPQLVTLGAPSPLIEVRVMVRAGSAHDPVGKEGLAQLTANALLEGGFGDPAKPTTKEDLARITRRWGEDAKPSVFVDKEVTTFSLTVPRDVLDGYRQQVLEPLFTRPLFQAGEVDRLRNEAVTSLTGPLRYEDIEILGLEAIDNYVFAGTSRGHSTTGSVLGLRAIKSEDVAAFYATYYKPDNLIVGISSDQPAVAQIIQAALAGIGKPAVGKARAMKPARLQRAPAIDGRQLTIVGLPDAPAVGLHLAFPIEVTHEHPDYWPLYVANVYLGTHRDGHGVLYQQIREQRGYNYGDYSYIEHFAYRPYSMFQPFNTPRTQQYFSIWIRPVADEYAHHILKAMTCELETLWRDGVSAKDVEASKNKAKVLYLNLAETSTRLLSARMDDVFEGLKPGWLDGYVQAVEAVTPEQVNAAVRRHLRPDNIKFLLVAKMETARKLAEDIRLDRNVTGKSLEDYQVTKLERDGQTLYEISEDRVRILKRDAVWENTRLQLDAARIRVVPVESLFESGAFVTEAAGATSGR